MINNDDKKDIINSFPGYTYDAGKSLYRGENPSEGGYVYSEPGMYSNVALLDVNSEHPNSLINLNLFGDKYTKNFKEILDARLAIKHKDFETAGKMFGGRLKPYLQDKARAKDLANALKIVINSVYGYTSASFPNKFRDSRNADNIVAKRGALFMIDLKNAVQEKGYTVAHIKTDSIKIPNATKEIVDFVQEFGKKYGYNFEFEAFYERLCLVNKSTYIAKYKKSNDCKKIFGFIPGDNTEIEDENSKKFNKWWTATGEQFQVPYVFKTLFSKEPLDFKDLCEIKTVTSTLYLDMNEDLEEDKHDYHFVGKAGEFCPIRPGCGGGILLREKDGKYDSANGAKGYRWLESEVVKTLGKEKDIDMNYFNHLTDEAVETIKQFGDFEWFVSDDSIKEDVPFEEPYESKNLNNENKEIKNHE